MDVSRRVVHALANHDARLCAQRRRGGAGELRGDHHIALILPAVECAAAVHAAARADGVSAAAHREGARRRCGHAEVFAHQRSTARRWRECHVVKSRGAKDTRGAAVACCGEADLRDRVRHVDRRRRADRIPSAGAACGIARVGCGDRAAGPLQFDPHGECDAGLRGRRVRRAHRRARAELQPRSRHVTKHRAVAGSREAVADRHAGEWRRRRAAGRGESRDDRAVAVHLPRHDVRGVVRGGGVARAHAGENVAVANLRALPALLCARAHVLRDPTRRRDRAADDDRHLIAHDELPVVRRDAQHIDAVRAERHRAARRGRRRKRRRTRPAYLTPRQRHGLRQSVVAHKRTDDHALSARDHRALRGGLRDVKRRRDVVVGDGHIRKVRRADVVAAGIERDGHLLRPLDEKIVNGQHIDHRARLARGDDHGARDRRVVRAIRRGAGDGEIHGQRARRGRGARDGELSGVARRLGSVGNIRDDRDGAAVVVGDGHGRRGGSAERVVRARGEREDHRLAAFVDRVLDGRHRDGRARLAIGNRDAARRCNRDVIAPARRRSAPCEIHRECADERAGARDREGAGVAAFRRIRVRGDDVHGREIVVEDRESVRIQRSENRARWTRQRDNDGLTRLHDRVVNESDGESFHGFAGCEGECAGRERVVRPRGRGAAGHGVVHGHVRRRGRAERRGNRSGAGILQRGTRRGAEAHGRQCGRRIVVNDRVGERRLRAEHRAVGIAQEERHVFIRLRQRVVEDAERDVLRLLADSESEHAGREAEINAVAKRIGDARVAPDEFRARIRHAAEVEAADTIRSVLAHHHAGLRVAVAAALREHARDEREVARGRRGGEMAFVLRAADL